MKISAQSKNERFGKIDMLLEKIEFGLMLNYFQELQTIFSDLVRVFHFSSIKMKDSKIPNKFTNSK